MKQPLQLENVGIKTATLRDRNKLLRLIKAYYRYEHIRFDRKMIEQGLAELLKHHEFGKAWLICNGARCVGYLILTFAFDLEFGGRPAGITDLFICSKFRRKGVGRRALTEVESFCRSCGLKTIELQVTKRNAKVLTFYERCGFRAHERIPMSKRLASSAQRLAQKAETRHRRSAD